MDERRPTADYKVFATENGNCYRFFCALSGEAVYTSSPMRGASQEEELMAAWENEGRRHFNRCHRCGKWVSNVMYNADALCCVDCVPWTEPPRFCPHCGAPLEHSGTFCPRCGKRIEGGEA